MKIKTELNPKVSESNKGVYSVYFWYKNKRFRYANASILGQEIYPNHLRYDQRSKEADLLCSAFELAIRKGWRPKITSKEEPKIKMIGQVALSVYEKKRKLQYSYSYIKDLGRVLNLWNKYLKKKGLFNSEASNLSTDHILEFIEGQATSPRVRIYLKKNLSALLKVEMESLGVNLGFNRVSAPKPAEKLHKPINNVPQVLSEIADFNDRLYICSLLVYGLLLRPHREIRCLKRGDFNNDFTQISLDGNRLKSKRNRVLPVPKFITKELRIRYSELSQEQNLFSGSEMPFNRDYFKGLWSKYKRTSVLLREDQTLYSFRHTGAIQVYRKTRSLQKLQQVMGHSDLKVSLVYLRGLDIQHIEINELPWLLRSRLP